MTPRTVTVPTFYCRIYASGPIEVAKQALREYCLHVGLCVTVEPTTFIYTGGEEQGYVIGLLNYPRFPSEPADLESKARALTRILLDATHQHSILLLTPEKTEWITTREGA
jgi:hypothetical protein